MARRVANFPGEITLASSIEAFDTLASRIEAFDARAAAVGAEYSVEFDVASFCCWGGTLRYTPDPHRTDGPDRSVVFYAGSGLTPDDVWRALEMDFNQWLDDGTLVP